MDLIEKVLGPLRKKVQDNKAKKTKKEPVKTDKKDTKFQLPDLQSIDWKNHVNDLKAAEKKLKPKLQEINQKSKEFAQKSQEELKKQKQNLDSTIQKGKEKLDSKLQSKKEVSKEEAKYNQIEKEYKEGQVLLQDILAPSSSKSEYRRYMYSGAYSKSLFVYAYPSFLNVNWMSPLVNFDGTMRISQFIYPFQSAKILQVLTKKVTQMRSEMRI